MRPRQRRHPTAPRQTITDQFVGTLVQAISDGLRDKEQGTGRRTGFLYRKGYNIGKALRKEVKGQLHAATIQYSDQINEIIRETEMRYEHMKELEHDLSAKLQKVHDAMRNSVKKGDEVTVVIKESAGTTRLRV